jgi:hypothetical protein
MPLIIKASTKYYTNKLKRAAMELRQAGVFLSILSTIRTQLKVPEGDIQALDLGDG